jgi:hypothetical protein
MAESISANLIAARQHTPQDIVMPQIMMDQAGRGMKAGQNKNDRRDRAVQFLNIVAQRFVARIKSRHSEQAKKLSPRTQTRKRPTATIAIKRT